MLFLKDLKKNGILKEIKYNENFAYVLEENDCFFSTDYKILQGQQDDIFLPCMKMTYNGKIQLVYLVQNGHSLFAGMQLLSARKIAVVVTNIVTNYLKIKNNGFLQCNKLVMDFDKIFFVPNTLQVRFAYLPINTENIELFGDCETDLRQGLLTILRSKMDSNNLPCKRMLAYLEKPENSLDKMLEACRINGVADDGDELVMKSINAIIPMVIKIDKPRIILGKSAQSVDVAIKESETISRVHCCVGKEENRYYVLDMGSLNGTFVNGNKVYSNQKTEIKKGDILKLSNLTFVLE